MVHRGVAGPARARVLVAVLVVAVAAAVLVLRVADRARAGDEVSRCDRFAADSAARAATVTGSGADVLVIGDSYSVGLGLDDPVDGWPARLPGRVHVAGFSGSGFSADASPCGAVSFAARAPGALRSSGARSVVVEGGLNDYDRTPAAITAGFERLLAAVGDRPLVVVGPPPAPSRAAAVPAVDGLLARLCAEHDVPYVRTAGLALPYLDDALHLTAGGHRAFGDAVASTVAAALAQTDRSASVGGTEAARSAG